MASYPHSKNRQNVRTMTLVAVMWMIAGGATEGSGQAMYASLPNWGERPNSITPNQGGSLTSAPVAAPKTRPSTNNYLDDAFDNDILRKYASDPRKSDSDNKTTTHGRRNKSLGEDEEEKNKEQEKDTGIKVNGQTLWQDANGNRYYYVNGDKKSPFISVEQKDGSFAWSTKKAMLNPVQAGQYGELGMIETLDGKLSTIYQLPDGSRAFSNGESWFKMNPGKDSFTQTETISFKNGSGTLTQYPAVGKTEPYKLKPGADFFESTQPNIPMSPDTTGARSGQFVQPAARTGYEARDFNKYYAQLKADPTAAGARNFLKQGPYGTNRSYQGKINALTDKQAIDLTNTFLRETRSHADSFSACPSCWLGAGGGKHLLDKL